jgi:hypothetical protein
MCNRDKAISLNYNINLIENWKTENSIENSPNSFDMLKQASDLLVMRKSEWDYDQLSKSLTKLNLSQIKHILTMYKPIEYCEKEIKESFIEKLLDIIKQQDNVTNLIENKQLTIDIKNEFSLKLKYKTSIINIDTIEIPDEFGLQFLIKF